MRLDFCTLIGIAMCCTAVILSMADFPHIDFAKMQAFVDPPAMLIVFVGGWGAAIASFPFKDLTTALRVISVAWFEKEEDALSLVRRLVEFAEIARRDGILALENVVESIQDPFMVRGVQLAVDGTDPELIEEIMDAEIEAIEERHMIGKRLIDVVIRNSPSFGMVGTLMGMVIMFYSGTSDPAQLTKAMAIALCATLYGALVAYLIGSPISDKLWRRNMEELGMKRIVMKGVLSIQAGDNPRIVEQKLKILLSPALRREIESASGKG